MCLVSRRYDARGHAAGPVILDRDRCAQWPDCVLDFELAPGCDGVTTASRCCDQWSGEEDWSTGSDLDFDADAAVRTRDRDQEQDVDAASVDGSLSETTSLDSFDFSEASMVRAAAATFPPEKNSQELRVINCNNTESPASSSSSSSSSSSMVQHPIAPGSEELRAAEEAVRRRSHSLLLQAVLAILRDRFFPSQKGGRDHSRDQDGGGELVSWTTTTGVQDHDDREVEDLIALVLSRRGLWEDHVEECDRKNGQGRQ